MAEGFEGTRRAVLGAGFAASLGSSAALGQPAPGARAASDAAPGLRSGLEQDQTAILQRAVAAAAGERRRVYLPRGRFRIAGLILPSGTQLIGTGQGATTLVQASNQPVLVGRGGERIAVRGLAIEGSPAASKETSLVVFADVSGLSVSDTTLARARGTALRLERCGGRVERNTVTGADIAIFTLDAAGLGIADNVIDGCANNGIQVWRSQKGYDGTQVTGNRIGHVRAEAGGSGQNGNGINVFRAGSVIVAQNVIRECAFTAVRNNSGDNIQILGNSCTNLGEVAIYAEFSFEGCIVANNVVDRAALGISLTNFNENGRLAVATGNVLRNLFRHPDAETGVMGRGIGIAVEADATVTGNVVEAAEHAGITIGYGTYLRDVICSGNVVRRCPYGVAVSVMRGGGAAQISNNILSDCSRGRIVGFEYEKPVSGDLSVGAERRFPQLAIQGNTGT
jgi:uncharacterized secreted repeat protein (TIGR03808 family)